MVLMTPESSEERQSPSPPAGDRDLVARAIRRAGGKPADLARVFGVSRQTVNDWKHGKLPAPRIDRTDLLRYVEDPALVMRQRLAEELLREVPDLMNLSPKDRELLLKILRQLVALAQEGDRGKWVLATSMILGALERL